jgi:hypothetical protein
MNALKIGLDWSKDSKGYRLIDYGRYGITVVGNGGKLVPTRPLENDMVFVAFANVDSQPKLLEFVHHYGLLEQPSYDGAYGAVFDATTLALIESRPVIYGEYVEEHLNTARMFRDMLMWIGRKGRASDSLSEWITDQILDKKLGEISIELVSGRGFQMVLRIDSLINGMLLQLVQKISGGSKFHFCEFCALPFEVGPGTGRRAKATFCKEEHKIKFHSRKRSLVHR